MYLLSLNKNIAVEEFGGKGAQLCGFLRKSKPTSPQVNWGQQMLSLEEALSPRPSPTLPFLGSNNFALGLLEIIATNIFIFFPF